MPKSPPPPRGRFKKVLSKAQQANLDLSNMHGLLLDALGWPRDTKKTFGDALKVIRRDATLRRWYNRAVRKVWRRKPDGK